MISNKYKKIINYKQEINIKKIINIRKPNYLTTHVFMLVIKFNKNISKINKMIFSFNTHKITILLKTKIYNLEINIKHP